MLYSHQFYVCVIKVDNTRVGQNSNLDSLEITIDTDGSISPRDTFEQAAAILVNQYTALAGSTEVAPAPALGEEADDEASELYTPVEDLNLTARTTNALVNNNIRTVHDLVNLTEQDLRELKGFGSKALDEVNDKNSGVKFIICTDMDIKGENLVVNVTNAAHSSKAWQLRLSFMARLKLLCQKPKRHCVILKN